MANTYVLLSTYTVGSGGIASFDFSSIPSTYTDLIVKLSMRVSETGIADISIRYNSDTGANYNYKEIYATGSAVGAGGPAGTNTSRHNSITMGTGITANTFSNVELYIPNYAGSQIKTTNVEAVTENNSTSTDVQMRLQSWKWTGTSAISTITVYDPAGGTMLQNATMTLYGIKNS
jgi:hypothetical protein